MSEEIPLLVAPPDDAWMRDIGPTFVRDVPAPDALRDEEGWVDYSCIDHLVVNGVVVACALDDPDERAGAASTASPSSSRRAEPPPSPGEKPQSLRQSEPELTPRHDAPNSPADAAHERRRRSRSRGR